MKFTSFSSRAAAIVGTLALAGSCIGCGSATLATAESSSAAPAVTPPASAQPAEEPVLLGSVAETSTTEGAPPTKAAGTRPPRSNPASR